MSQKVSDRDFVVCWATADTLEDVIKGTGLGKDGIKYRVKVLRERGVRLRDLPNIAHKEEEVKELNKLVDKYEHIKKRSRNGGY